jgi:hypothetical protein
MEDNYKDNSLVRKVLIVLYITRPDDPKPVNPRDIYPPGICPPEPPPPPKGMIACISLKRTLYLSPMIP